MVLRREAIEQRLKELDRILQELKKYKGLDVFPRFAAQVLSWLDAAGVK